LEKPLNLTSKTGSLIAVTAPHNYEIRYILQKKYPEAIILLREGLSLIDREEQKKSPPPENLVEVKYSLLKNLGWAKLEQSQYEEAQGYLLAAIGIASDPSVQPYIPNPGAAHCLLAQVLDSRQSSLALEQWQQCYSLVEKRLAAGEIRNPEEENWFSIAKKKLAM
jgi:tetratricopeptide (TPR) repeat protein